LSGQGGRTCSRWRTGQRSAGSISPRNSVSKTIATRLGLARKHGAVCLRSRNPPHYGLPRATLGHRSVQGRQLQAAKRVSDDAGDGDRRAHGVGRGMSILRDPSPSWRPTTCALALAATRLTECDRPPRGCQGRPRLDRRDRRRGEAAPQKRSLAPHRRITAAPTPGRGAMLKEQRSATRVGVTDDDVEQRDLTEYDRALGGWRDGDERAQIYHSSIPGAQAAVAAGVGRPTRKAPPRRDVVRTKSFWPRV
jgi:hypothetical protein